MNYLDILNEDILNKIFEIVADLYEKDIEKTKNKLSKVKCYNVKNHLCLLYTSHCFRLRIYINNNYIMKIYIY
jgi:hypothetical protein